jgi:hypothetical protein
MALKSFGGGVGTGLVCTAVAVLWVIAVSAFAAGETELKDRISVLEKKLDDLAVSAGKSSNDTGLPMHGFADVYVGNSGLAAGEDRPHGFGFGALSFYMTPQFTEHVKALFELAFEGSNAGLSTDLERVQVGYVFSDALTVWAGRFHTPYGYYNTAFHHGAQIQTSVTRPRFLDFEDKGGILPAHSVGMMLDGRVSIGPGKILYDAYVTNGGKIGGVNANGEGVLDFNFVTDDNNTRGLGATLGYRVGGVQAGVHMLRDDVYSYDDSPSTGVATAQTRVGMAGGYAVYDDNDWEVMVETYHWSNKDILNGGASMSSNAYFAQVGRAIGQWTPFARIEKTKLDQNDHYFADQASGRSYKRSLIGIRYDLDPKAAIKFEAGKVKQTDAPIGEFGEVRLQFAVRF